MLCCDSLKQFHLWYDHNRFYSNPPQWSINAISSAANSSINIERKPESVTEYKVIQITDQQLMAFAYINIYRSEYDRPNRNVMAAKSRYILFKSIHDKCPPSCDHLMHNLQVSVRGLLLQCCTHALGLFTHLHICIYIKMQCRAGSGVAYGYAACIQCGCCCVRFAHGASRRTQPKKPPTPNRGERKIKLKRNHAICNVMRMRAHMPPILFI